MPPVRGDVRADRHALALVKAFLKASILTEDGTLADTNAGTPPGSTLSPLLSNVALDLRTPTNDHDTIVNPSIRHGLT
jgi:RNA-directed DNA polymerase